MCQYCQWQSPPIPWWLLVRPPAAAVRPQIGQFATSISISLYLPLSLPLSLSGDQTTIEQITGTTRRLNLSNRWKFMANHQCIAVVRIERIVVNSADPPCCEISLCYQWDVPIYYPWDRFVRLFINLSAAIGLPRGPISAQSRLLPWMTHFQPTPHWCLITGLERVLLEMIQLPPKLRACHLQGVQGWQN